ncbi:putative F-box protein At1g32660 isoform X2 [Arabidopsis lyrata subsp. lyrata]|uniref:putative F-box protein At1g32660 isoform X2 n=1 Tax=Arabidopsis lyrata subsp. lyrata TaxID=81972 RepID=UPI000A29D998|nr:putative F-box protein At1g32660 isoform X2 [Arabidopsis lyrata subsp. lyrata]|eukprot:XP_020870908.1 putative F-box protein At1g32660 isoform X2 [Arabidopsis lyrata subsp. lyrata]
MKRKERDCYNENEEENEKDTNPCNTEQFVKLPATTAFVGYDPIDDQYKVLSWNRTRSEKLSFINAPKDVVQWGRKAVFIEYKGKLASIELETVKSLGALMDSKGPPAPVNLLF